jgi:rhodanese-related sulfurtransferase
MNWTTALIVVAVVVLFFLLKRVGLVSSRDAMAYLKKGAMVIDVRTAAEFSAGHLPRAINIPLSEVKELTPRRVKDKDQVLLLHCQSGARSASAKKILTGMGYAHTFNLGSYERAARIVGTR